MGPAGKTAGFGQFRPLADGRPYCAEHPQAVVRFRRHALLLQLVAIDAAGAPKLIDMGASFGIAAGGVLTLFIAAPPNGSSVWVQMVDEVSCAVFEQGIISDLPANTKFLSPRLFMNNGVTAAAVAYDCWGMYLETDI